LLKIKPIAFSENWNSARIKRRFAQKARERAPFAQKEVKT
jgi:hypothetical protein